MLLPYVMRFNLPARQKAFGRIAELLGEETLGMDALAAAERAILAVESLRQRIGIPHVHQPIGRSRGSTGRVCRKGVCREAAHARESTSRDACRSRDNSPRGFLGVSAYALLIFCFPWFIDWLFRKSASVVGTAST